MEYVLPTHNTIIGTDGNRTTVSDAAPLPVSLSDTFSVNGSPATQTLAAVSASSSGNNTIVAATVGKTIRVTSLVLVAASAVTVQLQSGAGGTNLTGVISLVTGVPFVLQLNSSGWAQTAQSDLLNLSLGGAVQVSGMVGYVEF